MEEGVTFEEERGSIRTVSDPYFVRLAIQMGLATDRASAERMLLYGAIAALALSAVLFALFLTPADAVTDQERARYEASTQTPGSS